MERRDTGAEREPQSGPAMEQSVVSEVSSVPTESEVVSSFNPSWRAVQLVYLIFGVIDGLLLIRLLLKVLGANPAAGFSNWIYNFTAIFLAPFKNILPTFGSGQSLLEMSVLVAVLVYGLLGWAIGRLVVIIFYRNVTVARRSGRLRPRGY